MTGLIHNGFANIYIEKNDRENAKKHMDIAQRISEESEYLLLKNEIYNTSQRYYTLTKDVKKITETKVKQDSVVEQISEKKEIFINEAYSGLEKKNTKMQEDTRIRNIIIALSFILLICGTCYFFSYRKCQRLNIENMEKLLADLNKDPAAGILQQHSRKHC